MKTVWIAIRKNSVKKMVVLRIVGESVISILSEKNGDSHFDQNHIALIDGQFK